jgi:hypothetical protein
MSRARSPEQSAHCVPAASIRRTPASSRRGPNSGPGRKGLTFFFTPASRLRDGGDTERFHTCLTCRRAGRLLRKEAPS